MPRRKKITMLVKDTAAYSALAEELAKNPLLADYDLGSMEISLLKKQPRRIQDVDAAIANLENYIATNGKFIKVVNGEQVIVKKDLAHMLGISRPTLDKWIENGFIKQSYSSKLRLEIYQTNEVLEQLKKYRNNF